LSIWETGAGALDSRAALSFLTGLGFAVEALTLKAAPTLAGDWT